MSVRADLFQPTCCPDVYACNGEMECPRHGGFDVCCDRPTRHIPQNLSAWHRLAWLHEQDLLDALINGTPVEDVISPSPDPAVTVFVS